MKTSEDLILELRILYEGVSELSQELRGARHRFVRRWLQSAEMSLLNAILQEQDIKAEAIQEASRKVMQASGR